MCSDCGHAHAPSPADVRGDWSLAKAFSMAFAIGIRPCTGAILVLILSNVLGLFWIGVVSTFAMAFGTFLTVSAIAALSVYARKLALRLASGNDRWLAMTGLSLRFGGGLLIAFLGLSLFIGSLSRTGGMV
jgi:ABC-type nickel/cobalt efflux system permease component RcnA